MKFSNQKIPKKRMSRRIKIATIAFLIIVLFVVVNIFGLAKGVKNLFYSFSSPLQKTFWKWGGGLSNFFGAIHDIKNLKKENTELSLKIQELLAENISLKEIEKENQSLREALNIGLEKEFKLGIAEIIGKDISQDALLINKGKRDGLIEGMPVITQQKILLGRIDKIYNDYSSILLISNKKSSFDAKLAEKEILGLVKGQGNLKLSFNLVPKDKEIKQGDLIVATSLGGVFPEGLLIGIVESVRKTDIEPFQNAEVSLMFNFYNLEKVFIILNFTRLPTGKK